MLIPQILPTAFGPTATGAGPELLALLLEELEIQLLHFGVDHNLILEPGVDRDTTASLLRDVGLAAPDEVLVWFEWHNGLKEDENHKYVGVLPFAYPCSIHSAIDLYKYKLDQTVPLGLWAEGWLPIELDQGMAVQCGNLGPTVLVRIDDVELFDFIEEGSAHQANGMSTVVAMWLEAFNAGALAYPVGKSEWTYESSKVIGFDRDTFLLL
jgi:hypothetical protein